MVLYRRIGEILKNVGKYSVRSKKAFIKLAKSSKPLRKLSKNLGKKILNKKTASIGLGTTAIGLTAQYVAEYIENNSGCFLYDENGKLICKVRKLSCCSPEKTSELCNFCEDHPKLFINDKDFKSTNICESYINKKTKSCCEYCDCIFHKCEKDEKMKCNTPTINEALSNLAGKVGSGILNTTLSIFPFLKIIGIIFLFLTCLFITLKIVF